MKHMERYLAATSGKNRNNADNEDHSAADSHGAVHDQGDALSKKLKKFGLKTPTLDKNIALGLTSHAVVHNNRQSTISAFSKSGVEFGSFGEMSIYDEVTVMDEEVVEEEVIEEVMEEEEVVVEEEEDEDYAWSGSAHTNSQRSRLSQKFPSGQQRSMRSVVSADSSMYEEETVATNAMSSSAPSNHSSSRMSYYDEVTVAEQTVADTVTEEVTVVEGNLDDYENQSGDDESNNSDLDSDDGIPDENGDDDEEENEGEGFTLAFKRNSASQARVSDITLDHSTWGHEMDGEFDDDEHHIPGHGEEGYLSKFKEGNFRSSLVSTNGPLLRMSTTKNVPSPSSAKNKMFVPSNNKNNKFLPSNKFSGLPKTAAMNTSSFVPKKTTPANPRRVSIMQQFANQPLPSLKEGSARKERGEKKKKRTKSFDGAGEKKELFMFWERKSSGGEDSTPAAAEESKTMEAGTDPVA